MPTQASFCWFGEICAHWASYGLSKQIVFFPFNSEQISNFEILGEQKKSAKSTLDTFKNRPSAAQHRGCASERCLVMCPEEAGRMGILGQGCCPTISGF